MQEFEKVIDRRLTIRNLAIFAFAVLSAGWIGSGLDNLTGATHGQGIGQLLWIVTPLLTMVFLRTFAGDGWKDFGFRPELKRGAIWYVFSLLVFPVCAVLIMGTGFLAGVISFPGISPARVGEYLQLVLLGILPSFVKNIFEEFAWRGYLAPKVSSLGLPDLVGHGLVGVIWAAWHVPYYLFYFDRISFAEYTTQGYAAFFPMFFVGVAALSIIYGEIRLLTRSVWPALLLHTVSNAFATPLFVRGFIKISPGADMFVSPGPESFFSIVVFSAIGLGLYRFRKSTATIELS
jgi:membrane protease YdiL (CAAX protease family)